MRPPAFPIAPREYDPVYMNMLLRILTQYLNQETEDELKTEQKADVTEVLEWLS